MGTQIMTGTFKTRPDIDVKDVLVAIETEMEREGFVPSKPRVTFFYDISKQEVVPTYDRSTCRFWEKTEDHLFVGLCARKTKACWIWWWDVRHRFPEREDEEHPFFKQILYELGMTIPD